MTHAIYNRIRRATRVALATATLLLAANAQAQMLAIKTDAASDALLIPNLNCELVIGNKTSLNISAMGSYSGLYLKDFRALGVMPEFRYWFHGRPLTREFIGLSVMGATYQFTASRKVHEYVAPDKTLVPDYDQKRRFCYDGDVFGVGFTFGYVWYLHERWAIEAHAGLGLYRYAQHRFITDEEFANIRYENSNSFPIKGWALLPYKVGVSFAYIIK